MLVQGVVLLPPGFGFLGSVKSVAHSPHVHLEFLHVLSVRNSSNKSETRRIMLKGFTWE